MESLERILVIVEPHETGLLNHSLEALVMAQQIARETGARLAAAVLGAKLDGAGEALKSFELDSVLLVEDGALADYAPETHAQALSQLLGHVDAQLVLFAHTYQNIDLVPRLAARLGRPFISDCVGFRIDGEGIVLTRQMFRNKLYADVRVHSAYPWLISVQAGAFFADELASGSAAVERLEVELDPREDGRKTLEKVELTKKKVDLSKAEIVIGVGRGIKKQENLRLVEELADALGAEIGASRPVVDNDWLERDRQIGSSGQTVSPKLYIAAGISGAIQHVVGMKNADCIVAINSDPNAPIFNVATYGIVGDLLEIIPALTEKIRQVKGI